jgi:branched-chain amino acid transport system permease protein
MTAYLVIGILSGAAYALLAVGFVLIYKGTRIFNLAHGEIGAFGLYVAWTLSRHVPVAIAALAGIGVAALIGLGFERTLVRRLIDRSPLAAVASTLGAGLTLAYIEANIWGINIKTFPSPFGTGSVQVGSVTLTAPRIASLVAAAAVGIGLGIFFRRTRFGLAVWASTSDQSLARLSGVGVSRARAFVWILGGALSGVSAILLATIYTFHPLSNTLMLVRAMAAALLGGLMSIPGAFVGGLAVGIVESLVIWQTPIGGIVDLAIFVLILGTLLVRPTGIFGARQA